MKLENQCCTLQQAKRLKELGVKQNSFAVWIDTKQIRFAKEYEPFVCDAERTDTVLWSTKKSDKEEIKAATFPAFTCAELGEMLPPLFESGNTFLQAEGRVKDMDYACVFRNKKGETIHIYHDKTEASARASMLIHLLEKSLITTEQINSRI